MGGLWKKANRKVVGSSDKKVIDHPTPVRDRLQQKLEERKRSIEKHEVVVAKLLDLDGCTRLWD